MEVTIRDYQDGWMVSGTGMEEEYFEDWEKIIDYIDSLFFE